MCIMNLHNIRETKGGETQDIGIVLKSRSKKID